MFYIILAIINVIVIFGFYGAYKRKLQKQIDKQSKEYIEKNKQKLETLARRDMEQLLKNRDDVEVDLKKRIKAYHELQEAYGKLNQQLQDQQSRVEIYETDQKARIDQMIQSYEKDMRAVVDEKISLESETKKNVALKEHEEFIKMLGAQTAQMTEQIQSLSNEIEDYTAKRAAINEAIMRQRAIDEQQDFYRVCLAPEVANDVELLNAIRRNLKKPEIIDKIIYDNYIAKPVLEMIKRVLQNSTCSGIYKITCLKTGEVYIGKSTDIKNRWQQHCKTVFNCGTIASSLLHTKMKQYGIENFTFELVEQVPKDQLSEREKFYINFYQTKEVGLNERNG